MPFSFDVNFKKGIEEEGKTKAQQRRIFAHL